MMIGFKAGKESVDMKYYVFSYWDEKGGGTMNILEHDEKKAMKKLKQYLNKYHPFRKFQIKLDQVIDV